MARSGSGTRHDGIGRAVGLSLAAAGGAAVAYALASYIIKQSRAERIALGQASDPLESFLKRAADTLQKGCQSIIESLDDASRS